REARVLLAGEHVVGAVGGVAQVVVDALGQVPARQDLHLGQVGHQVADGAGVPGTACAQAERPAQLVVVPCDHPAAAGGADGRGRQGGGGGLVHTALGVGERDHQRAVER